VCVWISSVFPCTHRCSPLCVCRHATAERSCCGRQGRPAHSRHTAHPASYGQAAKVTVATAAQESKRLLTNLHILALKLALLAVVGTRSHLPGLLRTVCLHQAPPSTPSPRARPPHVSPAARSSANEEVFTSALYQHVATLTQNGVNLPFVLPLKVGWAAGAGTTGGARSWRPTLHRP
jgi:hypothetical protein